MDKKIHKSTINNIAGLIEVSKNNQFDLLTNKDNGPYYLLFVEFETGDSFVYHEGIIEYVGLYTNKQRAQDNAYRIKEHHNSNGAKFGSKEYPEISVVLLSDDGKEFSMETPWNGYFESIKNIEILKMTVL